MSRQLTNADGVKIAQHIVEAWESIPERATKLSQQLGAPELLLTFELTMRNMLGGAEVYEAAKKVVLESGKE